MTGRHRDLKWTLPAGYRVPSLQRMSYLCILLLYVAPLVFFIIECGIAHMYSTFGHHSHPLCYHCAKFGFCYPHCWASPRRKIGYSITHSLSHLPSLFDMLGTKAYRFGTSLHMC